MEDFAFEMGVEGHLGAQVKGEGEHLEFVDFGVIEGIFEEMCKKLKDTVQIIAFFEVIIEKGQGFGLSQENWVVLLRSLHSGVILVLLYSLAVEF